MSEEIDLTSTEVQAAIAAAVTEAVDGLKAKNAELLGKLKKAQQGSTIEPADLEAAERERDEWKGKAQAAEKAAKQAAKAAEDATKRAADIDTAYGNTLRDQQLTEALTKAGVTNAVHLKAAKALLASGVQVVDENGTRVVKAGEVALDKHITDWASSDEGKHFVAAPDTTGGGAQGARGAGNPSQGDMGGDKAARLARSAALLKENAHL